MYGVGRSGWGVGVWVGVEDEGQGFSEGLDGGLEGLDLICKHS